MVVESLEQWLGQMYAETPMHIILEIGLIVFLVFLLINQPQPINQSTELTYEEEESLIREWKPLPVVPVISYDKEDISILSPKKITSGPSDTIEIDGRTVLNFGTANFLGLNMNKEIIDSSLSAIDKYSVGTCGPRKFYGTFDCHIELERKTAEWLNVENTVNYCNPFASTVSVIQAFVLSTDIVFVDDGSWFAVHLGTILCHCKFVTYRHNDMNDLKSKIKINKNYFERWSRCNRWVIAEGLFGCTGSILRLDELIELRKEFCLRLIIDESLSFGALGKSGRGICEHFNVSRELVELSIGSYSSCFASVGSFTVSTIREFSCHQRLASHAYIFSASPPPFAVVAAIKALEIASICGEEKVQTLRKNTKIARDELFDIIGLKVFGSDESPLIHLRLIKPKKLEIEDRMVQKICDECMNDQICPIAVAKAKYVRPKDVFAPRTSVKIFISSAHSERQIRDAMRSLKRAAAKFLSRNKKV